MADSMLRKRAIAALLCALLASCLVSVWSTQAFARDLFVRLGGADRYETMSGIVAEGFSKSPVAVVATGSTYPDALSASALAGSSDSPIILTEQARLSQQAKKQLDRLGVASVYLVGGPKAVNTQVESSIKEMGITVIRVQGQDRVETSLNAMTVTRQLGSKSDTVIIATGQAFADSLSIGAWAYYTKSPILLTNSKGLLTEAEVAAIKSDASCKKIVVVGGTNAVGNEVIKQLGDGYSFERLGGKDRYETSENIAKWSVKHGLNWSKPALASGMNFPDALSGTALCGTNGSPILLTADSSSRAQALIADNATKIETCYVLGGRTAISDNLVSTMGSSAGKQSTQQNTSQSMPQDTSTGNYGGRPSSYVPVGSVPLFFGGPMRSTYGQRFTGMPALERPDGRETEKSVDDETDGDAEGSDDEILMDTDGDFLPDSLEKLTGSDPHSKDSDDDGLDDFEEIFETLTDPALADTNGDGVNDEDEDPDGDTLSNKVEFQLALNPMSQDTDGDGLNDNLEDVCGTDPLVGDTDSDGALDGWEVENGFDPLTPDAEFVVSTEVSSESVAASVEIRAPGEVAETLTASVTEESGVDWESVPGIIGEAFDFKCDGDFLSATLTFTFDPYDLPFDAIPTIYCYNEEECAFEELETTIYGDTAVAELQHFSTYALLNKRDFDSVWDYDIKSSEDDSEAQGPFAIMFVIDRSASMHDNDGDMLFKDVCTQFLSKLEEGVDMAGVVTFTARSDSVTTGGISDDLASVASDIDSITYDSGHNRDSGTDGSAGLHLALEVLDGVGDMDKIVVFLTDGDDTDFSYPYEGQGGIVDMANQMGVRIYSVGMGDASEFRLRSISSQTNGRYYHATTLGENDIRDLRDVFEEMNLETVDFETDSNDDGISDYYTLLMCRGRLRAKDGTLVFGRATFDEVQANKDFDNDGIMNGDEIRVVTKNKRVYVELKSSPIREDSDDDGIDDIDDDAPLKFGLKGGVIGKLTLVARYKEGDNLGGHAFFAYQSYVKDDYDVNGLSSMVKRIDTAEPWRDENALRYMWSDVKTYEANANETFTFGGWGNSTTDIGGIFGQRFAADEDKSGINGVCINNEIGNVIHGESLTENSAIDREMTKDDVEKLLSYLTNKNTNYWSPYHNCAYLAATAWDKVDDRKLTDAGSRISEFGSAVSDAAKRSVMECLMGYSEANKAINVGKEVVGTTTHIAITPLYLHERLEKIDGSYKNYLLSNMIDAIIKKQPKKEGGSSSSWPWDSIASFG